MELQEKEAQKDYNLYSDHMPKESIPGREFQGLAVWGKKLLT